MNASRPLRGGCQCGRNRYIIAVPDEDAHEAQVQFNTEPIHQIPLATPLAAYIRVPLSWYRSTTIAFFPDETHAMIRRMYTHSTQDYSKRHFCGFCGTPLSYWSEEPRSEAEYINLTLGSLLREDLRDLEEMGLIPDESSDGAEEAKEEAATPARTTDLRQSFGVPWFDAMVEGTRLGNMRRSHGMKSSHDGKVNIEWDIVEYTDDGDVEMSPVQPGKRKLQDRDDLEVTQGAEES